MYRKGLYKDGKLVMTLQLSFYLKVMLLSRGGLTTLELIEQGIMLWSLRYEYVGNVWHDFLFIKLN